MSVSAATVIFKLVARLPSIAASVMSATEPVETSIAPVDVVTFWLAAPNVNV